MSETPKPDDSKTVAASKALGDIAGTAAIATLCVGLLPISALCGLACLSCYIWHNFNKEHYDGKWS